MRVVVLLLLCLAVAPGFLSVRAQTPDPAPAPAAAVPGTDLPPDAAIREMDAIEVVGVQPGPGMWKVSRGEHVMWVLGTQSPLPKKMQWVSRDVEQAVAQAQEVIWAPTMGLQVNAGRFAALTMLPKLLTARRNPDGETLQQVVPAAMYARWQVLKAQYIGHKFGLESWRPIFAAMELWEAAIDDVGLKTSGVVGPVVGRIAKQRKLKQTWPNSMLLVTDAKAALNEFRAAKLEDLDCFGKTLDRIETDLVAMKARANAWAIGDIEALRALPYTDQMAVCMQATKQAAVVRKRLDRNLDAELERKWFDAAEKALAGNQVTFAMLPMAELLKPDGYLVKLQAKGYEVEAP